MAARVSHLRRQRCSPGQWSWRTTVDNADKSRLALLDPVGGGLAARRAREQQRVEVGEGDMEPSGAGAQVGEGLVDVDDRRGDEALCDLGHTDQLDALGRDDGVRVVVLAE